MQPLSHIITLTIDILIHDTEYRAAIEKYFSGLLSVYGLLPRMANLRVLKVYNLPRFVDDTLPTGPWRDTPVESPMFNPSTLILSGFSPPWVILWGVLRHLRHLSNLDLSRLESPSGAEALDESHASDSELSLNVDDLGSARCNLEAFSCNIFHLHHQCYSTAKLVGRLAKHGCFNELRVVRLHLDSTSSGESTADEVKDAVCDILRAAPCSLQYLMFIGFPLRESLSSVCCTIPS